MVEGPLVRQGVGAFHIQPAGREERPSKLGALNVALRSGSSGPCGAPSVDQPLGLGSGPGQMFRAVVRRRPGDRPCRGGQTRRGVWSPVGRRRPRVLSWPRTRAWRALHASRSARFNASRPPLHPFPSVSLTLHTDDLPASHGEETRWPCTRTHCVPRTSENQGFSP